MKLSQSGKRRRNKEGSDYPIAKHSGSNTDCMGLLGDKDMDRASIEQIQNCTEIISFIQKKFQG